MRRGAGEITQWLAGCVIQDVYSTGRIDSMSHRKWRETKQQPSRARSVHQLSCFLVCLHFLCDILQISTVDRSNLEFTTIIAFSGLTPPPQTSSSPPPPQPLPLSLAPPPPPPPTLPLQPDLDDRHLFRQPFPRSSRPTSAGTSSSSSGELSHLVLRRLRLLRSRDSGSMTIFRLFAGN